MTKALAYAVLMVALLAGCNRFDQKLEAVDGEAIPGKKADWREGGWGPDFHLMVSFKSIRQEGQYVYVWLLRKFAKDQKPKDEDPFNREYAHIAIQCTEMEMAEIARERYYRKKQDADKFENEDDSKADPTSRSDVPTYVWQFKELTKVAPGGYQQAFVRQVCAAAEQKEAAPSKSKKK